MSLSVNEIKAIHVMPASGVFMIAGGGLEMLHHLLRVPGASGTVLEGIVPYAGKSMDTFLGFKPDRSCSEETARAMAMAAYRRALDYDGTFGFAMTSALTTNREKKGKCRTHIAYQDRDRTLVWSYELLSSQSRIVHETLVAEHGMMCLNEALTKPGSKHWFRGLMSGSALDIRPVRKIEAILPGSFNPMHHGHARMQRHASERLGKKVYFELCINNADKGYVDYIDLDNRLENVRPEYDVEEDFVYTNVPLIIDKARVFGKHLFIVAGIDTMTRIANKKYYGSDHDREMVFRELNERHISFLVYGRKIGDTFWGLRRAQLPYELEILCYEVPEDEFRMDVSSTDIRSAASA